MQFFDSRFVAQGEGREVTRVKATGIVRLKLNIATRGNGILRHILSPPDVHAAFCTGLQAAGYSVADAPAVAAAAATAAGGR
jgi:hypothetical protein